MADNTHCAPVGNDASNISAVNVVEETYHSTIIACEQNGTKVIVKKCRHLDDPRTKIRWRNEVDVLKLVAAHENITQLLGSDSNELTITLRLEDGNSLDKQIDSDAKSELSVAESNLLWKQMASALAHLHSLSVTHDDVKPENIVWSPTRKLGVLIDFGAALNHNVLPLDYFNPSGTPNYAGPDFLSRKKGPKGDVWALGVTILFTSRYIKLPDGEWLLPAVWEEGEPRAQMLQWLQQIEELRGQVTAANPLLASMLVSDYPARISSLDLLEQLDSKAT